jgi:Kef-type K+ transport system membrane component KefB
MASISSPDSHAVYPVISRALEATVALSGNASAPAPLTPFANAAVLDDTLLSILAFLIVLVAAHPLGMLFPKFLRLPLITGYLLVGVATGPFVANLLTTNMVQMLQSSINAMALSFISFQAGQEIYLPELKPQIKGILQLLAVLYGTAMVLLTAVLTLGAGPFFYGSFDGACKLAIGLLFGSIAVLGSPATVMAIKIELNSVGPFTNLMLGATMTAEFVVLISFSIARVVSSVYCAKLDITLANLVFTMAIVFSNILVGVLIGGLILAIFLLPGGGHGQPQKGLSGVLGSLYFKGFVWLFMGYVFYISTTAISEATIAAFGHVWDVKFEPLLVLMVGACLAGHHTQIRHDMHIILDASAPFVFLPFFVMTGAGLKLNQVANAIPLMSLFVALRYAAIFLACYGAGRFLLKLPPHQYNNLWLTMTPQAGVALGLANEIKSLSTDPWASEFAATIVAAVVVNQIVGPVLCAMGLTRAGESGGDGQGKKGDHDTPGAVLGEHEEDDDPDLEVDPHTGASEIPIIGGYSASIRQAVVVGDDDVAFELAVQLVLHGASVTMPLLEGERAGQWDALHDHVRSGYLKGDVAIAVADFRAESKRRGGPFNDNDTTARVRAATTDRQTDLVIFTGDDQRALDHVRQLSTMGGRKPRLVAILTGAAYLDQLRSRGVVCIQASVALSNLGLRVALLDSPAAMSNLTVSTEVGTSGDSSWLDAGARADAELQRALLHRRRVLQRNVQTSRQMQSSTSVPAMNVAPQRVSMFGRSSAVEFLSMGRGHHSRPTEDMYIMDFEDGALDEISEFSTDSTMSARRYVAASHTPDAKEGSKGFAKKKGMGKDRRSSYGGQWA